MQPVAILLSVMVSHCFYVYRIGKSIWEDIESTSLAKELRIFEFMSLLSRSRSKRFFEAR